MTDQEVPVRYCWADHDGFRYLYDGEAPDGHQIIFSISATYVNAAKVPLVCDVLNNVDARDEEIACLTNERDASDELLRAENAASDRMARKMGEQQEQIAHLSRALEAADELDASIPRGCIHDEYLHSIDGWDECYQELEDATNTYRTARAATKEWSK